MTYSQSAKGQRITRDRLIREMADHQVIGYKPTADEMADVAEACKASAIRGTDLYSTSKLLSWLGY